MRLALGIVAVSVALAQTPLPSPFPVGVSGGGGSGTVTSVGLAGTANQITVTGTSPITSSGSWTLSFPTNVTLPGNTTGTFIGNLTGTASTATNALSLGGNLAATYAPLASPTFTGTVTIGTTFLTDTSSVDAAQYKGDFNAFSYDATSGGTYTDGVANPGALFDVQIITAGTPDQFRWRKNAGAWSANTNVTGLAQALSNGVTVTFGATTGDGTGDVWTIETAYRFNGKGTLLTKHSGFGSSATINGGGTTGDTYNSVVTVSETITEAAGFTVATLQGMFGVLNPATDSHVSYIGQSVNFRSDPTNVKNFDLIEAADLVARHTGSGIVTTLEGQDGEAINSGAGTIVQAIGVQAGVQNRGAGSITQGFGFYAGTPYVPSGTMPFYTAIWAGDGASGSPAITNNYYSWFDSRGVRRVKEDSTFDSVGQAIEALYNPQFTKYTAGATDFERVVLGQWNGNVAEIGIEKGGTGTLRSLRLLGTTVMVNSLATATDSLPVCRHANGALYNGTNTAGVLACP